MSYDEWMKEEWKQYQEWVSTEERESLIEERNMLVKKNIDSGLSKKEERRLTYVRWQLDRIDDADYGEGLDFFEKLTENYESFASDIKSLVSELNVATGGRRHQKK